MKSLKLILGSSSTARCMLLQRLNIEFTSIAPDIDETPLPQESPEALVARLTEQKGQAIAKKYPNSLIISADQVIVVNGQAISKPVSYEDAVQQLLSESGQEVEALSGLGLRNAQTDHYQYCCVKTRVRFQHLTLEQIHRYLAKDPAACHCAGSLRVEALGISLLEEVQSDDPTALIGLPLIALTQMLRREAVAV